MTALSQACVKRRGPIPCSSGCCPLSTSRCSRAQEHFSLQQESCSLQPQPPPASAASRKAQLGFQSASKTFFLPSHCLALQHLPPADQQHQPQQELVRNPKILDLLAADVLKYRIQVVLFYLDSCTAPPLGHSCTSWPLGWHLPSASPDSPPGGQLPCQ